MAETLNNSCRLLVSVGPRLALFDAPRAPAPAPPPPPPRRPDFQDGGGFTPSVAYNMSCMRFGLARAVFSSVSFVITVMSMFMIMGYCVPEGVHQGGTHKGVRFPKACVGVCNAGQTAGRGGNEAKLGAVRRTVCTSNRVGGEN